jgi:hypothetical protein
MIATWGTVVLGFLWLFPASAQQSGSTVSAQDPTNAMCAEKIQIPSFPSLARQARLSGTLSVNVKLGPSGTVDEISAQSHLNNDRAQAVLLIPIEKALRNSQFRRDCAGKLVILEFDFRIDGDPYDSQTQEVAFGYPNRFWITTRPPIPTNSK